MRALLSTIGSRGDVQPLVALALQLRALGHDARFCVPPDFRGWIEGLGFAVTPIGPELRALTAAKAPVAAAALPPPVPLSVERRKELAAASVAAQFATITAAADGCDIVVGATALQIAARSVAEIQGVPYVFVAYAPNVLPSSRHAPPVLGMAGETPSTDASEFDALWARSAVRFNETFGDALNAHRATLGLAPVREVGRHVYTDRPWLAADAALAPWPDETDESVFQSGAWIVPDDAPLDDALEAFLASGDPPVYFGFGSMRAPPDLARVMIDAARAQGRRAIVSRGWADLALVDDAGDTIAIGEVNQHALFPRVAAVVHHGGAGTTTAAALCGAPQVTIPQMYDQHFWAQRVASLGIGAAHAPGAPSAESLTRALAHALAPAAAGRARTLAAGMRRDGATIAARRLVSMVATGGRA